jgi:subtilase family serine protease
MKVDSFMLLSWLHRVPGTAARTQRSRPAWHRVRLALENLEERTLLSGSALALLGPGIATSGVHRYTGGGVVPAGGPGQPAGFSPGQISQAYGFNLISFSGVQGDGTGQTIALVDAYDQPNIVSDLANFDSMYGLSAPPSFLKVNQTGGTTYPTADQNWGLEISLDVEWAHAMAPGAKLLLVEANSDSLTDLFTAVDYARSQPGVAVVSMSWGASEWLGESSYDTHFTTPSGHSGVTFVASTGDDGSAGLPEYPSASANVLAVGGTQLTTDTLGNYQSETGWSGSTGGPSAQVTQPAYQHGVVTQSTTMRTVPDVAYNASSASPYAIYDTSIYSGWLEAYGTSAGAPQWAALVAIADQGRALSGLGALDGPSQTLPLIYQLPGSDFHDITTGNNGGYSAGPGYDLVTGLGTPRANLIAPALAGITNGPTVTTSASASSNPVTGTTTNLSVLGTDPAGASSLTYTWSVTSAPTGAAAPTFSVNGTNAAQNTTVTFYQAGSYTFQVTLTDPSGLTAASNVSVTVNQTLTSITVSPATATLADGTSKQFKASAKDQFGKAMSTQPAFSWTLINNSLGTVSTTGLYKAPGTGTGTATVQASAGGVSGTATVTYGPKPAAPSNLAATTLATPQVNLSWTDNSSNETSFLIQRYNGTSWVTIATVAADVISYSDTTVKHNTTYKYRVCASNSFGNSAYSNIVTITTP